MAVPLEEIIASLPQESQDRIAKNAEKMVQQTTLRQIRKALGITQKQLAETLKKSQAAVSKQEQRQEIFASTLRKTIKALGGEIIARFPGDKEIRL